MAFIGKLVLKEIDDEDDGRQIYELMEDFGYFNSKVSEKITVMAKKGFHTDLASIPSIFFFLKPNNPVWDDASVIHDRACQMARVKTIRMGQADSYLYYAMRESGATLFTALVFWFYVRLHHIIKLEF